MSNRSKFLDLKAKEITFGCTPVELCQDSIEVSGQKLVPDKTKAYCKYGISQSYPVVTAWGTTLHPGTVARSHASMLHQVFNLDHLMKIYAPEEDRKNARDRILGSVVAVEFPNPHAVWSLPTEIDKAPRITAASVIHKAAEGVQKIIGEHLTGRHRWSVSMEINYALAESGFLMPDMNTASKGQREILEQTTPVELSRLGMGYVPAMQAPDELLDCYNMEKKAIDKTWGRLPALLMKAGLGEDGHGGNVHYMGVGLVRYGAEREAEILSIMARAPMAEAVEAVADIAENSRQFFQEVSDSFDRVKRILDGK